MLLSIQFKYLSSHKVKKNMPYKICMPYAIFCSKGLASLPFAEHAVLCCAPISYTSIHVSKSHPNILLPGSSKQYRAVLRSESKLYVNWPFSKQIIIIRSTCSCSQCISSQCLRSHSINL